MCDVICVPQQKPTFVLPFKPHTVGGKGFDLVPTQRAY